MAQPEENWFAYFEAGNKTFVEKKLLDIIQKESNENKIYKKLGR